MDRRVCRPAVLAISARRADLDVILDAVEPVGGALLLVPDFDRALSAIRSGFRPDAIVVDLVFSTDGLYRFLRSLFEERVTRRTPVVGTSRRRRAVFQLAPRDARREVPFPSSPAAAGALLEVLVAS